ncbi:Ubiquitin-like superfamily protein [Striga hermonthica]|uniref:Ubiquitin-like superfamily protein n=1 Tax=Striga hermonthica TaxID=68872 RepID=A0A9N7RSU7_STRHE|nr:Ubiquitin-like superfamily protein [Striga hermonthica]
MELVAEVLTGSLFSVKIEEEATVEDLKNKIGNQENLPTQRLILMLNADDNQYLLDNDQSPVKDYGIRDGSRIYIFFQPPSNRPASPSSRSNLSRDSISRGDDEATQPAPPPPECTSSHSDKEKK